VQQVVHHPQPAAGGAVKAGGRVKRTRHEDLMAVRIDQIKQNSAAAAGDGTDGGLRESVQLNWLG
jgi:hypothetical protein